MWFAISDEEHKVEYTTVSIPKPLADKVKERIGQCIEEVLNWKNRNQNRVIRVVIMLRQEFSRAIKVN